MSLGVRHMFIRCGKMRNGVGEFYISDTPPLPCFLQEYDSMRVRWWGSAKNVILWDLQANERKEEVWEMV
jgi:hypothetical protein